MRALVSAVLVLVLSAFLAPACSQESGQDQATTRQNTEQDGDAAQGSGALTFYNWEEYTGTGVLEGFAEQTGIRVDLVTFEDDEAILGALQSGAIDPDLLIVSASVAREMVSAKLLAEIDLSRVPNAEHIHPRYLDPDPPVYSVPYLTGTTGLAVNTAHVQEPYDTWAVLWDERYAGHLAMLDNPFEALGGAAKLLGHPLNPESDQALAEIQAKMRAQKPLLHGYHDSIAIQEMLEDGTLWAAQIYSGEGLVASDNNPDVRYVIPREGCAAWYDVFVIPRGADRKDEALRYIDYVHTPEVMAAIASEFWYASTNTAAERHMDPEVLESPAVYAPKAVQERFEFFGDMGSGESVRRRLAVWAELTDE